MAMLYGMNNHGNYEVTSEVAKRLGKVYHKVKFK